MTSRADFSDEEWDLISQGPPTAGMIVITAQRGGTLRESFSLAKSYVEARQQHHGESAADREHAGGIAGVRHSQRLHPGTHPLNGGQAGLERLLGKDAEEILAAVAVEGIASARLTAELVRHGGEHVVAGLMTVRVVVGLEVIDVDQRHAVAMPVALNARLEQLEVLLERPAVA